MNRGDELDEDAGDSGHEYNWTKNEKYGDTNVATHSRKGYSCLGNRRGNPMRM